SSAPGRARARRSRSTSGTASCRPAISTRTRPCSSWTSPHAEPIGRPLVGSAGRRTPRPSLPRPVPTGVSRVTHPPTTDPGPAVAELDTIVSLAKRRGFVYPSSEIYGGINAVWDYGPLGVELKNNVKRAWWRAMVQERDDIVGLDAGILMHPRSG